MHTPTAASPVVRLRVTEFRERAKRAGLLTDSDIADRLGMHRISVWRLLTEQTAPGINFVGAVLDAFPEADFPDFFEVTRDVASRRGAA